MTPASISGRLLRATEALPGTELYRDALRCVQNRFGSELERRVDQLVQARQAQVTTLTEGSASERALAVLAQSTVAGADSRSLEILALLNRHPTNWGKRGYGTRLLEVAEGAARQRRLDALTLREVPGTGSEGRAWLGRRGFEKATSEALWMKRVESAVRTPPREESVLERKRPATEDAGAEVPFKLKKRDPNAPQTARPAAFAEAAVYGQPTASASASTSSSQPTAASSSSQPARVPYQARRAPEGNQGRGGHYQAQRAGGGQQAQGARQPMRMTLKPQYLAMIARGQKTWEGRLNRGAFGRCRVGEEIVFYSHTGEEVKVRIDEIKYSSSFEDMVRTVGFKALVPNVWSEQDAVGIYRNIYGIQDRGCGCVALKMTVLSHNIR